MVEVNDVKGGKGSNVKVDMISNTNFFPNRNWYHNRYCFVESGVQTLDLGSIRNFWDVFLSILTNRAPKFSRVIR